MSAQAAARVGAVPRPARPSVAPQQAPRLRLVRAPAQARTRVPFVVACMAILAAALEPPVFKCPNCGGVLEFDDLPERYFAFLQADDD